ncbi:hypothetical protein RB195_021974 [Necator americanus]|uniref:CUB domain-containing protein n=1 Tax=Necator americanus TaxID=51031 RepID=A0ABR1EG58_NECAM
MKTGVILNLVPGGFRCKDNKNLCVHGMDGSRYVSASGNTVIWPVPYCKGSSCSMLLTLDPTEAVNEYRGKRDKNNVIYYNGNEYNYIEMKAITCGGCDKTLNMCYSIDRYEGGRPLPADAYDNAQASATEEQYSSLGYGDNTQYIQPDGVNPYADETNSPSPTPTNNGYEQQLSNAPSQPLSDSPASRAQLIARLNAANRRLVQTRTNVRTLQTQVAVQRARAQTALQTARAIGRPTINVRPANVNVKVNANPRITNVNQNQLTAEQRAQQAANTGGSPAPTGSPSSPAPAGSPSTSVAALRMHSPVIDEKHFVDLTGKAEKPSEEMLSMIEQQNENFLLGGKSTIKIAQPNILWKVRRESNSAVIREKKTMRDDTQESVGGTNSDLLFSLLGDKASLTGPPGQEPSLQWISSHRTMRR